MMNQLAMVRQVFFYKAGMPDGQFMRACGADKNLRR